MEQKKQTEYIKDSININRSAIELFKAIQNPSLRKEVSDNLLNNITIEKTVENSSVHWKGTYEDIPYYGTIQLRSTQSSVETEVELVMSFSHEAGVLESAATKIIVMAGENIAVRTLKNFKTIMEN